MAEALRVEALRTGYDQADVLSGITLEAAPGAITCILGANGAGKSTLIRALLGLLPLRSGKIFHQGVDITGWPTHRIIARGVACIPEGRRVFPKMTVRENLLMGAYLSQPATVTGRFDRVFGIFPRLRERASQLSGTLSGGEQAMLSIGRGLMAKPRLLLIDEPSLGLSPLFVKETFKVIATIHALGIGVLLVEQNVHQTLALAHFGYVLSQGRVVASGESGELLHDAAIRRAYFGAEEHG